MFNNHLIGIGVRQADYKLVLLFLGRERALNKDDVDLVWARLLSCIESRLLMGCSSGYKSLHPQELDAVGLVSNHAYSILDVRLVHGEK